MQEKHYSKEDKRRYLILQCRCYTGEADVPDSLPEEYALMWNYEKKWVEWSLEGDVMIKSFEQDIRYFHLENKDGDKTPLTLKALLCNRYFHWSNPSHSENETLKAFEEWYLNFYLQRKTNREQRADKRRPELINKCKYFHGESNCPYSIQSEKDAWTWEKEWVEMLADSWMARERIIERFLAIPQFQMLTDDKEAWLNNWRKRAEHYAMPYTLLLYLVVRYEEGFGGFKHEMEEYFDFWIHDYAHIKHQND